MADSKAIAQAIRDGRTSLGIEFGSTRIKAVLIDDERNTITTGDYGWQSHLVDGLWSYDVDKIWRGLQSVYADVADRVEADYGLKLTRIGQIGFSAMMHGYLAFDADGELLLSLIHICVCAAATSSVAVSTCPAVKCPRA